MMDKVTIDGILTAIRKDFYAMRNGMIADTLRKGGLEQKYIFGLQLPQIKEIAARHLPEHADEAKALARALWCDPECREARLLACHMMPPEMIGREEAGRWAADVRTREEADILAFRLLRYLPYAEDLADTLATHEAPLMKYTGEAIRRFI